MTLDRCRLVSRRGTSFHGTAEGEGRFPDSSPLPLSYTGADKEGEADNPYEQSAGG
jgi:hypothetical protein